MSQPASKPEPEETKTADLGGKVADAVENSWVDTRAPARTRPYLRLSRADRPIGTWLLWLPCVWGALLAAAQTGQFDLRVLWVIIGCGIGSFVMRGAGCTWNDFTDRDIDAQVARTKSRPLPSGQVTPRAALVWLAVQCLIGLCILLTFGTFTILLGVAALLPVAVYPFAKRFTWWPQLFLGVAFNWGALVGFAAVADTLTMAPVFLYLAGIAWTLFYDTIYAHQDKEDDALIGVKSTARLFGDNTGTWLKRFLVMTVVLLSGAMIEAIAPRDLIPTLIAIGGAWAMGWHMVWQMTRLDIDKPDLCMRLFRSNRDAGLLVALFLAVAVAL